MQNDSVIWDIINHQFCSFKSKIAKEHTFCQNPYNVSGLCLRSACPLANSRYATIREEDGVCYLYMKTIERAHTPKKLWEKIRLPDNYAKALEIVSKELDLFPKYLVHRNKQRLTKIHQMIIRMRKLKLKVKPKIVATNTKVDRREVIKERHALKAAQLDKAIENELLERLKQVSEGEIYNYPERQYSRALSRASKDYAKEDGGAEELDDEEDELEYEEEGEGVGEEELEDEDEEEQAYNIEYVEDFEESDGEGGAAVGGDVEDAVDEETAAEIYARVASRRLKRKAAQQAAAGSESVAAKATTSTSKGRGRNARVEVEYEEAEEEAPRKKATASNSW